MLILKHLKNAPTCFDHYSDHLQGARRFLVKVTEFKSFYKVLELWRLFVVICGYLRYAGMHSSIPLYTECHAHAHQTLCCCITTNNLHNFKKRI